MSVSVGYNEEIRQGIQARVSIFRISKRSWIIHKRLESVMAHELSGLLKSWASRKSVKTISKFTAGYFTYEVCSESNVNDFQNNEFLNLMGYEKMIESQSLTLAPSSGSSLYCHSCSYQRQRGEDRQFGLLPLGDAKTKFTITQLLFTR